MMSSDNSYADHAGVGFSRRTFVITFGVGKGPPHTNIFLNPVVAKQFCMMLKKYLLRYEREFETIIMSPDELEAADIVQEDW